MKSVFYFLNHILAITTSISKLQHCRRACPYSKIESNHIHCQCLSESKYIPVIILALSVFRIMRILFPFSHRLFEFLVQVPDRQRERLYAAFSRKITNPKAPELFILP